MTLNLLFSLSEEYTGECCSSEQPCLKQHWHHAGYMSRTLKEEI